MRESSDMNEKTRIQERGSWRGRRFLLGYAAGILTTLVVAGLVLVVMNLSMTGLTLRQSVKALFKLNTLTAYLKEEYLEEVNPDTLLEGAYAGLVKGAEDQYTRYYTPEEYEQYLEELEGSYAGIGVSVQWDKETEMLKIVTITEGGPGAWAGLCVGDSIYAVDDTIVQGMDSNEVIRMIKGVEGTTVALTVVREGESDTLVLEATREEIVEETVTSRMLEDQVGYIAISSFDEITTEQFENALQVLKSQNMQGLILDLRNNPGGRLNTAAEIADDLLPEGTITYTETKKGEQRFYTSEAETCLNLPMVVLVNENSASASEIVAGAIQDMEAGTLVGTITYGKGIVQSTYGLPDGSAIKLTMAKYYTPNGRYIHGIGITPDIEITQPAGTDLHDVLLTEEDLQFATAWEAMQTMLGR